MKFTHSRKRSKAAALPATARTTYTLLTQSEFVNVTYKELPDWGHAYPYSINETLLLPWFESLPSRSPG